MSGAPFVFSTCSTLYLTSTFLTSYGNIFPESFGRSLFSSVRSTAFGLSSIPNMYSARGILSGNETKLASAIDSLIDDRIIEGIVIKKV